jgi:integrase/recombinase XerD
MNHRSSGLRVSDAIAGFLQFKLAEGLSPRTIVGYRDDLREWLINAGDKDVTQVNAQEIRAFLIYLRTDYKPLRFSSDLSTLSPKTIRSLRKSLSAV